MTIRDKDRLYDELYLSVQDEGNASPYARLKAVMDYWCALWFWPIAQADELPDRSTFLFQVRALLGKGVIGREAKLKGIQTSMFEDTSLAPAAETIYQHFGANGYVNLKELRELFPALRIANEVADQQKFFHWELEFSDVFESRGGFDLVVGNPPWIKLEWNEEAVLGDREPRLAVKKFTATQTTKIREALLRDTATLNLYLSEYESISGQQAYLGAKQNYSILSGAVNLFKCFLPQAWMFTGKTGFSSFLHPEGVFDDPKGTLLREEIYKRLRFHFQFQNELLLFPEVAHRATFSINVYSNDETIGFDTIANLFVPSTIDECYSGEGTTLVGFKDDKDNWSVQGHSDRIIHVGSRELKLFSKLFDDGANWKSAKLPVLHAKQLVGVLSKLANAGQTIASLGTDIFSTGMWPETKAQEDGIIERNVHFATEPIHLIYSGPHIGVGNPLFKTSRRICTLKSDFDSIDLTAVEDSYLQRCNYEIVPTITEYESMEQKTGWGIRHTQGYRILMRRMLNQSGERTLIPAIIPPHTGHIHTMTEFALRDEGIVPLLEGMLSSIVTDYYIKTTGRADVYLDTVGNLPIPSSNKKEISARALLLNCLTTSFGNLWKECFDESFIHDRWAKQDQRLRPTRFTTLTPTWTWDTPLRTDYERRQALVEIDVLTAMALGMTLDQLKTIYRIQFPVLQQYEADTWYDANGRIVFTTNRGLTGVGFERKEWESGIKGAPTGTKFYRTITDDTQPGGPVQRTIEYVAPFDRCDREKDYETAWEYFSKRNP